MSFSRPSFYLQKGKFACLVGFVVFAGNSSNPAPNMHEILRIHFPALILVQEKVSGSQKLINIRKQDTYPLGYSCFIRSSIRHFCSCSSVRGVLKDGWVNGTVSGGIPELAATQAEPEIICIRKIKYGNDFLQQAKEGKQHPPARWGSKWVGLMEVGDFLPCC